MKWNKKIRDRFQVYINDVWFFPSLSLSRSFPPYKCDLADRFSLSIDILHVYHHQYYSRILYLWLLSSLFFKFIPDLIALFYFIFIPFLFDLIYLNQLLRELQKKRRSSSLFDRLSDISHSNEIRHEYIYKLSFKKFIQK